MSQQVRILVVEDEKKVAEALRKGLEAEGYAVCVAHSGEDGFIELNAQLFDLVLLDVMLPGRDGLSILGIMRKRGFEIPVLVLTARDTVEERVAGLDSGADDYLVKPFAFPELLARIRLLLRRGRKETAQQLTIGDLEIDLLDRRAVRRGERIELTPREFELLAYLMRNSNSIVSREMLARDVWDVKERSTPMDNVIDVHIARLRRKIDGPFGSKLIKTVRGLGFLIGEES